MSAESNIVGVTPPPEVPPVLMTKSDFARYIGRSEVTVSRLIRDGVIIALHDGRSVTIPVRDAMRRYMDYLKAQGQNRHRPRKPAPEPAVTEKHRTKYGDLAFATGDFIVDDMKTKSVPEQSSETPE